MFLFKAHQQTNLHQDHHQQQQNSRLGSICPCQELHEIHCAVQCSHGLCVVLRTWALHHGLFLPKYQSQITIAPSRLDQSPQACCASHSIGCWSASHSWISIAPHNLFNFVVIFQQVTQERSLIFHWCFHPHNVLDFHCQLVIKSRCLNILPVLSVSSAPIWVLSAEWQKSAREFHG